MSKYTEFVHEFTDAAGSVWYAVGRHNAVSGQYYRDFDATERKLTGCSQEFARTPAGIQNYPTKRQALRRARYLYGDK
jgi:hypothetical protein